MKPASLSLDRLEFSNIHVSTNPDFEADEGEINCAFPQLNYKFSGVNFLRRTRVNFPDDEANDPRHFHVNFAITAKSSDQKAKIIPYEFEIEVSAFLTYLGDQLSGVDRFKAVRYSAYPMLYGAIREMLASLTARSTHGLWQLPSADFRSAALEEAQKDEERRLSLLKTITLDTPEVHRPSKAKITAKEPTPALKRSPRKRSVKPAEK
jgi:hypothetical protein